MTFLFRHVHKSKFWWESDLCLMFFLKFSLAFCFCGRHGGLMVSALVSCLEQSGFEPWLGTLCSWARHFTLTVPLSTQEYKWVPANCWGNLTNCWEVTCDGLASRPGGVEILLAASCYRIRDKLWQLILSQSWLQGFTFCFCPFLIFLLQLQTLHLACFQFNSKPHSYSR